MIINPEISYRSLAELDAKLAKAEAMLAGVIEDHQRFATNARYLAEKAATLVALFDDAEVNHGSLIGPKTLRAVGELRLELSRWK